MIRLVLFVLVLSLVACSDPAPVAPHPAGKANCALCAFLGDDNYTIADADEQDTDDSTDNSSETEAEADSAQVDPASETDSAQADSSLLAASGLGSLFGDDRYTIADKLFADANLERAVRQALNRPQGSLTPEDFAPLITLSASDKDIRSLVGLEHLTALQALTLSDNQIVDITPLNQLTNLKRLDLKKNEIADITPLTDLTNNRLDEPTLARPKQQPDRRYNPTKPNN